MTSNTGRNTDASQQIQNFTLVPAIEKQIYKEGASYLERIKWATNGNRERFKFISETLDRRKLVTDSEEKRNVEINKLHAFNIIFEDSPYYRDLLAITKRIAELSKIHGCVDTVFDETCNKLMGAKADRSGIGRQVKNGLRSCLRDRLYSELFPDMSGKKIAHVPLTRKERIRVHQDEQDLVRLLAEIKDIGIREATSSLALAQEQFWQNIREIAGIQQTALYR